MSFHSLISSITFDDSITLDDELSTASVRGNSALDSSEAPLTKPSRKKSKEELGNLEQDPDLHRIRRFESSMIPTQALQSRFSRSTSLSSSLPSPMPVRKASVNNMGLIKPMQKESAKNLRNATFKTFSSLPMKTDALVGVKPELAPLISKDLFQTMSPQVPRPQISKEQLACVKNDLGPFGRKDTGSFPCPPLKPKRKASSDELLAVHTDY
jgi:hypothetical protein